MSVRSNYEQWRLLQTFQNKEGIHIFAPPFQEMPPSSSLGGVNSMRPEWMFHLHHAVRKATFVTAIFIPRDYDFRTALPANLQQGQ